MDLADGIAEGADKTVKAITFYGRIDYLEKIGETDAAASRCQELWDFLEKEYGLDDDDSIRKDPEYRRMELEGLFTYNYR